MSTKEPARIQLECTECHFSEVVSVDGEKLPADIVREHGKQTGHKVRVSPIESE